MLEEAIVSLYQGWPNGGSLFAFLAEPEWEEEFAFNDNGGKPLSYLPGFS